MKQKIAGINGDQKDLLLALIVDSVRAVLSGLGGTKMPPSIAREILGNSDKSNNEYKNLTTFAGAEDFLEARYRKEEDRKSVV